MMHSINRTHGAMCFTLFSHSLYTYFICSTVVPQSFDSVVSQPVSRAQVVAYGVPQVILLPDGSQHGHDSLQTTVHKCSGTFHHISPAPMTLVSLLCITAIEGIVEVEEVKPTDCIIQLLPPFSALCSRVLSA